MEARSVNTTPGWGQHQTPSQLEALLQPLHRPTSHLRRAVVAASYPLRGIWYFLRHRELHPLLYGRLFPLTLISFLIYFLLFAFTFLPQVAFLAIWQGWSAWINAVFLVLGEGFVIIQVRSCITAPFSSFVQVYYSIFILTPHSRLFLKASS